MKRKEKKRERSIPEQKTQEILSEVFDTTRYPHGCSTDEKVGWIDRRSACECQVYINPICPTFFWRCARIQCAPTFYSSIQPYISSLCHPKNHSIYPIWYGDEFFSDPVASRSHICVLLAVLCRLNA